MNKLIPPTPFIILIFLFSLSFIFPRSHANANPLIYLAGENGGVYRYDANGSNEEELIRNYYVPIYATVDHTNGKFYWGAAQKVMRCDFDGSNFEILFDTDDGVSEVIAIAVDPDSGFVYWTELFGNKIIRGNIDGSGTPSTLFSSLAGPVGITVDTVSKILYWGSNTNSQIMSGNASGEGTPSVVTASGGGLTGVALDRDNGLLYWNNFNDATIQRSDLNGNNKIILYQAGDGVTAPAGIAVDGDNGKIYVADSNGVIDSGNTDGSGTLTELYDISSSNGTSQGVGVTTDGTQVIFTGDTNVLIGSSDGTATLQALAELSNSTDEPSYTRIDVASNKMYFIDLLGGLARINRVDLDLTSNTSRLLSGTIERLYNSDDDGIGLPSGLVLDTNNNFLYWSSGDPKIQRGAIDGSTAPVDLFDNGDGLNTPRDLVLVSSSSRLYWIDTTNQEIVRGNADGTGSVVTLFDNTDGLQFPTGLAVDPVNGILYWGDQTSDQILVGDISGSGSPTVLFDSSDGVDNPTDIQLDLNNGMLYYTDSGTGGLFRGNIDGTGTLEEIISDLSNGALHYITLLADSDNDGSPDGVDGCENDSAKTAPGDCGCGEADSDTNSNSISDCLLNTDAKDRIATLLTLVRSLKFTGTKSRKKNRKRRKAQKETLETISTIREELSTTISNNLSDYNLADGVTDLTSFLNKATQKVSRVNKTGSRKFKQRKKGAVKALNRLNNALANS